MTNWTEKMVMEHARELKSPFENVVNQRTQPDPQEVLQKLKARGNGSKGLVAPTEAQER